MQIENRLFKLNHQFSWNCRGRSETTLDIFIHYKFIRIQYCHGSKQNPRIYACFKIQAVVIITQNLTRYVYFTRYSYQFPGGSLPSRYLQKDTFRAPKLIQAVEANDLIFRCEICFHCNHKKYDISRWYHYIAICFEILEMDRGVHNYVTCMCSFIIVQNVGLYGISEQIQFLIMIKKEILS